MVNPTRKEQNLFNDQFKLITEDNEFRMSHWVSGFGIADGKSGDMILNIMTSFNLEKFEETRDVLKAYFNIYPNGAVYYEAEINPFKKIFVYKQQTFALENFESTFKEFIK